MQLKLRQTTVLALVTFSILVLSHTITANNELRYVFVMEKPVHSIENTFEDDFIRISFQLSRASIGFILRNKTDNPIVVDWNQVSYVDALNQSHKVMHGNVRYVERDRALPPSVIPPDASLTDVVLPVDYVSYSSGRNGGWVTDEMFPNANAGRQLEGKRIAVFLPLIPNGTVKNYNFVFSISTEIDPNTRQEDELVSGLRHAGQLQLEFTRMVKDDKDHPGLAKTLPKVSEQMANSSIQMATEVESQSLEKFLFQLRINDPRPAITEAIRALNQLLDAAKISDILSATAAAKIRETKDAYTSVLKVYNDLLQ